MAVTFATEHTRTSEYLFNPAEIVVKPELNGRHEAPDIEPLIASIVKDGQLEPGIVRKDGEQAVLCAGFSRWRAITEINKRKLTPVPLSFRAIYQKANELDGFLINIYENRFRNQTTRLDDAYNVRRLEQWGQTEAQIAAIYGADIKWVKQMQKLVALDPAAQKAVANGRVKPSAIAAVAKLTNEKQREVVAGSGRVSLPTKPKETVALLKAQMRVTTLVKLGVEIEDLEVFNRERVLRLIKAEVAAAQEALLKLKGC